MAMFQGLVENGGFGASRFGPSSGAGTETSTVGLYNYLPDIPQLNIKKANYAF
jgi:hypothetical protein